MFKEKKAAIVTCVIALLVSILLPLLLFGHEFSVVKKDTLFFAVWVLLAIVAVITSLITIAKAEDPRVSNTLKMLPVIAAALLAIWDFGWCADQRARASEKIKGETSYLLTT